MHIIAEAGTNHNGDINKALELVQIGKRAQADSVKFQIINPWGLYLPGNYEYGHYDIKNVIKIREAGMLLDSEYEQIDDFCTKNNIPFSASIFDSKGLDLLMKFDPPYVKTASCDLNNTRFLKEVAERGKKMVISTGMSTLQDIENSVEELAKINFNDIVLLHCVSVYPALLEQTNLSFITLLKKEFGFEVGFSDHTGDSTAACIALAKGATWFEKHYTEDKRQEGFDHAYAMEEKGFSAYVGDLKKAKHALEPKPDKLSEPELYTRKRARRSLYASKSMVAGTVITSDDILCVRPEGILDANQIDQVIGKKLNVNISQNQPFTLDQLL